MTESFAFLFVAVTFGALAASFPFGWIHRRRTSAAAFALHGFLWLLGYASFVVALRRSKAEGRRMSGGAATDAQASLPGSRA